MRELFEQRHDADVEHVPSRGVEGANASLAEDDVLVTRQQHVLGGEQPLFHGGGEPALEQDWFSGRTGFAQERKVLHVARADLQHVGV